MWGGMDHARGNLFHSLVEPELLPDSHTGQERIWLDLHTELVLHHQQLGR